MLVAMAVGLMASVIGLASGEWIFALDFLLAVAVFTITGGIIYWLIGR